MNKICTDILQSKKIIELGIDVNTADMHYMYRHWEIDEETVGSQLDAHIGFDSAFYYCEDNGKTYHYIPAWSLTALISILPRIDIEKEICVDDTYDYRVKAYIDDGYVGDWFDDPIDACYNMIITLHELNLL